MKRSNIFLSLLIFLGAMIMFFIGFQNSFDANKEEDLKRVEDAVKTAILECYSIEGNYPSSLAYLEENYGLYINKDQYTIHYVYIASNIMPESQVFRKGE